MTWKLHWSGLRVAYMTGYHKSPSCSDLTTVGFTYLHFHAPTLYIHENISKQIFMQYSISHYTIYVMIRDITFFWFCIFHKTVILWNYGSIPLVIVLYFMYVTENWKKHKILHEQIFLQWHCVLIWYLGSILFSFIMNCCPQCYLQLLAVWSLKVERIQFVPIWKLASQYKVSH